MPDELPVEVRNESLSVSAFDNLRVLANDELHAKWLAERANRQQSPTKNITGKHDHAKPVPKWTIKYNEEK